ncbi:MAG: hypothetical protein H6707_19800 [Deltaproteobacteria bacterium]|nr:hypothetical protein [Deltaproteobacteria bacterium]
MPTPRIIALTILLAPFSACDSSAKGEVDAGAAVDMTASVADGRTNNDGPKADAASRCSGCRSDQTCSAEGKCVDLPKTCPCPKNAYCDLATNTCKSGCARDDSCDQGLYCDLADNACKPGCRGDAECTLPWTCVDHKCSCDGETDQQYCQSLPGECSTATWTDRCGQQRQSKCGCAGTSTCCSDSCVDLKSNKNNCGACGVKIPTDGVCDNGVPKCSGSLTNCASVCLSTLFDEKNCGKCGRTCSATANCDQGNCVNVVEEKTYVAGMTCDSICGKTGATCVAASVGYTDGYWHCAGPKITCDKAISRYSSCNGISVYLSAASCTCHEP